MNVSFDIYLRMMDEVYIICEICLKLIEITKKNNVLINLLVIYRSPHNKIQEFRKSLIRFATNRETN